MAVNWNLAGGGNNALSYFQFGANLGQQARERRDARDTQNALAAYAKTPGEDTLAGVIDRDPELGIRLRQQQASQQTAERQQRRVEMGDVARLFDGVTAENYGQRIALAQQMGVDVSGVPQAYDPAWVGQQQQVLQFFQQRPDALSDAGKKAIDAGFQPGTPEFQQAVRGMIEAGLAQPYMGSEGETRLYTPQVWGGGQRPTQAQAGPQPGAVEDGYRFRGGNPADPASWEPVNQGGPGGSPSGAGFPGG